MNELEATSEEKAPLRVAAIVAAAIALTALFMVLRFPYDRVALRVAQQVEQRTGTRIALGDVGVGWVRWAPGLVAQQARIVQPDGTRFDFERAGVRPALSLAWLRGDPALAIELTSALGGASGVVTLGDGGGFDGDLRDVDLARLPQDRIGAPLRVQGRADADVDLVFAPDGPVGSVAFEAHDGVVTHPELPLPMPFERFEGEIDLGGNAWATIRSLTLQSPLASGSAHGTVERAPSFASAPLRLEVDLSVSGVVQSSLAAQGVSVGDSGQIHVTVTGTPLRPLVR